MIVVGSINVHDCTVEKYIPIWLIVCGAFSLIKSLTNFYYRAKRSQDGQEHSPTENVNPNPFDGLLSCFLLAWFIAGMYIIYYYINHSLHISYYYFSQIKGIRYKK